MSFPRYPAYIDSGVQWIPALPAQWDLKRFKSIFAERIDKSESGDELLLSVSAYTGVTPRFELVDEGDHLSRAESLEGYKRCFKDDLVMNIMLAWNRGLAFTQFEGIVSPAYCVFKVIDGSHPGFLNYLVRSDDYTAYFKAFSSGVIDSRLRIYPETFGALFCALPPTNEQIAIATFLDRETAKIDALVAEQEKLIALLQEKRQAVISHAVTKGLDPNVPMKDSGVEWLGEVPEHWEVKRVKHVKADEPNAFVDGPFGSNLKSEHYVEDGDVYVIESSFATQGVLEISNLKTITHEHFKSIARSETKAGDIIIAKIGAQFGKCSILPMLDKPAVVSGNSLKLSVNEDVMNVELVCWQLVNLKQQGAIDLIVNLTAQPALSLGSMNELPILVPPKTEQIQIVGALALKLEQYDSLVSEARTAITLLQERRTALISAAVTGQIDVRGLATRGDAAQALAILDRLDRQDQDAAAH